MARLLGGRILLAKLNGGLKVANFKLQAFLLTPLEDFFDWYVLGATFGYGFLGYGGFICPAD